MSPVRALWSRNPTIKLNLIINQSINQIYLYSTKAVESAVYHIRKPNQATHKGETH